MIDVMKNGITYDWAKLRVGLGFDVEDSQWFEAEAVVCCNCRGKGTTVNPSIDGNGLSQEDFAEDPDFADAYRSGLYDVACCECHGKGMTLMPTSEDGKVAFGEWLADCRECESISRAERAMGA